MVLPADNIYKAAVTITVTRGTVDEKGMVADAGTRVEAIGYGPDSQAAALDAITKIIPFDPKAVQKG